jgi:7-cyano-7-deazaguanine reductase
LSKNPLGKDSAYPDRYAPEVLCPIARQDARDAIGLGGILPFGGEDIWNAYELTWLEETGRPAVATAVLRVPASSEYIFESKSLKIYLNSVAMCRYSSVEELRSIIARDLSEVARAKVSVKLTDACESESDIISTLPGTCIDTANGDFSATDINPSLLTADAGAVVDEELHSHVLRSNCPVTNQPDLGSVLVRYRGPRIDHSSLLGYIVSFRQHNDFHESCVERIFIDIKERCKPQELSISAHYTRRGGIDINPFRSDFEVVAANIRLWRQ